MYSKVCTAIPKVHIIFYHYTRKTKNLRRTRSEKNAIPKNIFFTIVFCPIHEFGYDNDEVLTK